MSVRWLSWPSTALPPTDVVEVVMVLCWMTCCWEHTGVGLPAGLLSGLRYPWDSFCMAVMGQSLCVNRSCLSCVTSFFSMVTSFCSCMLVCVSSSAFFSNDITHTFLFCLQRVAAARFLSRNFRRRSSGSSSTTRLRRPPLGCGGCRVCVGCICCAAGDNCEGAPE